MNNEEINRLRKVLLNHSYVDLGRSLDKYRESRSEDDQHILEFKDIFKHTNQISQDMTKIFNYYILDVFFRKCQHVSLNIIQKETSGSDCFFNSEPHEIKVTRAKLEKNGLHTISLWNGNKFPKTSKLILISYFLDFETNRISSMFVGIIDLSEYETIWKHGSVKVNYSKLQIPLEDADKMQIIIGSKKVMNKNAKYQHFLLEKLKDNSLMQSISPRALKRIWKTSDL